MSYLVFARKWRPQNFDQVIGQKHIATTLKNAISLNRVAHAYLFSGPRGIGKTSTARILAKALNCEQGPAPSPCNRCSMCLEISDGRSLDVIEIDGASNRGIEQIRQLRENVKFAPAKCRFKIYIIDEVHQITTDGFNALLKTLEEPPAHVKFIFATTQAHKVLSTILSRCQRFDFKPLSVASIEEKLKQIIREEKLVVSEEAMLYIARAASGSMRDAESILDQLSSFCRDKIELDTVTSVLGMIDFELLWEITQKIIESNSADALTLLERIINEGKDLAQLIAGLMEHARNILILKTVKEENAGSLIDLPKDFISRISEQAKVLSLEEIFYIFNVLVRAQERLRKTLSGRVIVEMAIVKLTQRENLSSLEDILTRLTELEQNLGAQVEPPKENSPKEKFVEPTREEATIEVQDEAPTVGPPSGELNQNWLRLLQLIKDEKMFLASILEFAEAVGLKDNVLTIAFGRENNFHKETLEDQENRRLIEAKTKQAFGCNLKVKFISNKDSTSQDKQRPQEPQKKMSAEPIIQSAIKMFHGRIVNKSE